MEGREPKPQHISEVGFQIRTMKEKAPKAGCAGAGGLARVWRAAAHMCKVASVHAGRSHGNSWAPSRFRTCQRLGRSCFPRAWRRPRLCLERHETPGSSWPRRVDPEARVLELMFLFDMVVGTH